MKPTLETAGPLLVPVDESGTAVGMPGDAAPTRAQDLETTLRRLYVEAISYRDTGRGREHLTNALIDARRVLEGGAL